MEYVWIDCGRFGAVVGFVDPNKAICQFKHVVAERNDDELCIFGAFLAEKN